MKIPGPILLVAALAVVVLSAASCKRTPPAPPPPETALTVLADETLRDAFTTMLTDFNWEHRAVEVTFSFARPDKLRQQMEAGAAADLVALCDPEAMKVLAARLAATPTAFARDEIVTIVAADRAAKVHRVEELSAASRQQSLQTRGLLSDDVAAAKVVAGEAEAAIVSRTVVRALRDRVAVLASGSGKEVRVDCAIATTAHPAHPVSAAAWIAFLQTKGQQALRDAGFLPFSPASSSH